MQWHLEFPAQLKYLELIQAGAFLHDRTVNKYPAPLHSLHRLHLMDDHQLQMKQDNNSILERKYKEIVE